MYYIKYIDMFRAILCSSSGGQNCIFTSDIVTLKIKLVMIPYAVKIQFWLPEDEHSIARNMSRYLMLYMYYRIKELCIKLVIKTSLYYDARWEKQNNTPHVLTFWNYTRSFMCPTYIKIYIILKSGWRDGQCGPPRLIHLMSFHLLPEKPNSSA
jgi:hypothetical protein